MTAFAVLFRKEWLEHWRNYRFLVLLIVLTLFGLLAPLTARYGPELLKLLPNGEAIARLVPPPTARDAVAQYLKNVSQFGAILALLLTMGVVAQEKDKQPPWQRENVSCSVCFFSGDALTLPLHASVSAIKSLFNFQIR